MSKIAISPGATGNAVFTIQAPSTETSRTLTLPDEAGTVLTSASTVAASQITGALNATGSAPIYACRAWVNFNGTGTVTIRASGNVSSITDLGVGNYRANFTTAMPDVNYAAELSMGLNSSGGINASFFDAFSTSSIDVWTYSVAGGGAGAYRDTANVFVAIFR